MKPLLRCMIGCLVVWILGLAGEAMASPLSGAESLVERNSLRSDPAKTPSKAGATKATDERSKSGSAGHKEAGREEAKKAEPKKAGESSKPATYSVKKRPMRIEYTLDGLFEARTMTEVSLRCKEWSDFEVLQAVPYGARVTEGDMLLALDTEKIDRTIADLAQSRVWLGWPCGMPRSK